MCFDFPIKPTLNKNSHFERKKIKETFKRSFQGISLFEWFVKINQKPWSQFTHINSPRKKKYQSENQDKTFKIYYRNVSNLGPRNLGKPSKQLELFELRSISLEKSFQGRGPIRNIIVASQFPKKDFKVFFALYFHYLCAILKADNSSIWDFIKKNIIFISFFSPFLTSILEELELL